MFIYKRRAVLQSAHFNDAAYPRIRKMEELAEQKKFDDALAELFAAALDMHGHNFRVEVEFTHPGPLGKDGWLIDDFEVAAVFAEWDGKNLSLHADFFGHGLRATTENMARLLADKMASRVPAGTRIRATVWENDDLDATYIIEESGNERV